MSAFALRALDQLAERERVASQRVCAAADLATADVRATRRAVTTGVEAYTRDSRPVPRVLVVDDETAVREGLVAALRVAGLDAEGAATIDAAREALQARPAVLVVDVLLGRDGLGVALLGERHPYTRALIVSAHTDTPALAALARVARAEWMPRPVSSEALVKLVARVRAMVQEATS